MASKLTGVLVAPATPLTEAGGIHFDRLDELIGSLIDAGVDGICVGGGTAEYPRFDVEEREELIRRTVGVADGRVRVIASVGMASFDRVLRLGRCAADLGVEALLLPPPHFFAYQQDDLEHFYREANRQLPLPCLLYNLPAFTTPLERRTAAHLFATEEGIVGIKDSSGDPAALGELRSLETERELSLIMGNDKLLLDSLKAGWDGAISGLGNLFPELLVLLYRSFRGGDFELAEDCQRKICRVIEWVVALPVPWAIRSGLEVRGIPCGPFTVPPSPARATALREFQRWFERWLGEALAWASERRATGSAGVAERR